MSWGLVLVLGLTLGLIPWRYETPKISALYQILYFSSQLYAVVRAMSIVLMELAILGVISGSEILFHLDRPSQELLVSHFT